MFRPVRNKKNEINEEAVKSLLINEPRGILALNGEDGYPYAIPVNFLYSEEDNKIYFHGAPRGYKVEMIRKCDKVCFTLCGNITVKDEAWAPYVSSAVVFGRCRLIEDKELGIELVRKLALKYFPDPEEVEKVIDESGKAVQLFEIEIEHMSGKEVQEK